MRANEFRLINCPQQTLREKNHTGGSGYRLLAERAVDAPFRAWQKRPRDAGADDTIDPPAVTSWPRQRTKSVPNVAELGSLSTLVLPP
jgi:hypothetical protein